MADEQKESSVLFSLQELFSLEQERIKQEEDEKKRRIEMEARAREEADRRAREEEHLRLRQEEEKRRIEELRKREESARIEALRQGEIERAKIEAEQQARIEAMKHQQAHAYEIAKLKQDKGKKNLTIAIAVTASVLLIGGSVGIWQIIVKSREKELAELQARQETERQEAEKKRLQQRLDEQSRKVDELVQQLTQSQNDAERAKLLADLNAAKAEQDKLRRGMGGGAKKPTGEGAKKDCPPGDPMCGL